MYLELAKNILNEEYSEKRKLACDDSGKCLIEEKIVHSYQVLGAGNMILKNELFYHKYSNDEIDLLKATVLLHDLGRFQEAVQKNIDHGVYGADLLRENVVFNDIRVILAIKHHGHLIEALYDDAEYLKLDENLKKEVQSFIFLVRDADKIANFYLLSRKFEEMEKLFFNPVNKIVSQDVGDEIFDCFMSNKAIDRRRIKTLAEHSLMVLGCVFDINFRASFEFLDKTKCFEKIMKKCEKFWHQNQIDVFEKNLMNFILSRK